MADKTMPEVSFLLKDRKTDTQWVSGKTFQTMNEEIAQLQRESRDLNSELSALRNRVNELESPSRLKKALSLLETQEKPRTFTWIQNRVHGLSYWEFHKLLDDNKVSASKKANHVMYSVVPEETKRR